MSQQREDDKISSCNLLRGGLKILGYDLQYVSPFIILKNLCQSPNQTGPSRLICARSIYICFYAKPVLQYIGKGERTRKTVVNLGPTHQRSQRFMWWGPVRDHVCTHCCTVRLVYCTILCWVRSFLKFLLGFTFIGRGNSIIWGFICGLYRVIHIDKLDKIHIVDSGAWGAMGMGVGTPIKIVTKSLLIQFSDIAIFGAVWCRRNHVYQTALIWM